MDTPDEKLVSVRPYSPPTDTQILDWLSANFTEVRWVNAPPWSEFKGSEVILLMYGGWGEKTALAKNLRDAVIVAMNTPGEYHHE